MGNMRKLQDTTPESHIMLVAGKFMFMRKLVSFSAVVADMCMEQTVNRASKNNSSVIRSTYHKMHAVECELICHEIKAKDCQGSWLLKKSKCASKNDFPSHLQQHRKCGHRTRQSLRS